MADLHRLTEAQLEDRLRAALRSEAEALPFTLTVDDLIARRPARRSTETGFRSRLGGLAAAALLLAAIAGLAGMMAGGWFERLERPAPDASPGPALSPLPSELVVPSDAPDGLATLDDLTGQVGLERVVLAQAFGPSSGAEDRVRAGPVEIDLGTAPGGGPHRLWVTCRSEGEPLRISADPIDVAAPAQEITCDGSIVALDLDLSAEAHLRVHAVQPIAWRAVLARSEALGSVAGDTLPPLDPFVDEEILLADEKAASAPPPGPQPVLARVPLEVGGLSNRPGYSVLGTCLGVGPVRYALMAEGGPAGDQAVAQVELPCDGRPHRDRLDMTLIAGGTFVVEADPRATWRFLVVVEPAPIALAPAPAGWQTVAGVGPDLRLEPRKTSFSLALDGDDLRVSIVVTCLGGSRLEVVLEDPASGEAIGTLVEATCNESTPTTSSAEFVVPSDGFTIVTTPDAEMWLAVTVHQPVP